MVKTNLKTVRACALNFGMYYARPTHLWSYSLWMGTYFGWWQGPSVLQLFFQPSRQLPLQSFACVLNFDSVRRLKNLWTQFHAGFIQCVTQRAKLYTFHLCVLKLGQEMFFLLWQLLWPITPRPCFDLFGSPAPCFWASLWSSLTSVKLGQACYSRFRTPWSTNTLEKSPFETLQCSNSWGEIHLHHCSWTHSKVVR